MRILSLVLVVGAIACAATAAGPHPMVVVGFLDSGWPTPSGRGAPGANMMLAQGGRASCQTVLDSAVTDATGHFRLVIPDPAAAIRAGWHLCQVADSGPPRLALPMLVFVPKTRVDSLQLYCREHGPSSTPECRAVPWGEPMHWPGGEGYDSVPGPA